MRKSETLTIRLEPELRARVEAVRMAMPYKPTVTAIVERGFHLALAELELMTRESVGGVRLQIIAGEAATNSASAPHPIPSLNTRDAA